MILDQTLEPVQEAIFDDLKSFSRSEVELLNWYSRTFRDSANLGTCLKEAFSEFLEVPVGTVIHLGQASELSQEKRAYRFEKDEILIGRGSESDVLLDLAVISRRHARIVRRNQKYFLEDLGSSTGTYLNQKKLAANSPEVLFDGDRILVFPYVLECKVEEIWQAAEPPELWVGPVEADSWDNFEKKLPVGFCRSYLSVHPDAGELCIVGDHGFLQEVVARITRTPVQPLVASDSGIFQFLAASVLERANREVQFPFQFLMQDSSASQREFERGLSFDLSIGLSDRTGSFKVFLPQETLSGMRAGLPALPQRSAVHKAIATVALVSAGYLDLHASEVAELQRGDVVLFEPALAIVLPQHASKAGLERGWRAVQLRDDPLQIEAGAHFEQRLFMEDQSQSEQQAEASGKPDLGNLPIRLHAVLSQVEMTLTELESLVAGSVLELNRKKTDPIQLAVNGKILGSGRLVDVEGKLGVQVTNWGMS